MRCSASRIGECAPDRHRGDKRGELRGWVLRGPGKARHMEASWNQGKGLSVGGGEGTMLEAAEGASKWRLPEGHRGPWPGPF